ncbi:MAG: hypothetical protein JXA69_03950 [Phycisphaerae bacterium]|nr:hypothetical protein [Phycisphaerae bacterium]
MVAQGVRTAILAGVALSLLLCGACNKSEDEPKHRTIEGVAESVDPKSNQVSMSWYNAKKQRDERVNGMVNDDTEVLINGRVARLEDIVAGDSVKVTGRVLKSEGEPQYLATRIEVTREGADSFVPATEPATDADASEK